MDATEFLSLARALKKLGATSVKSCGFEVTFANPVPKAPEGRLVRLPLVGSVPAEAPKEPAPTPEEAFQAALDAYIP